MLDCFVCYVPGKHRALRLKMFELACERWALVGGVRVHRLTPGHLKCGATEFQKSRRMYADSEARSDPYILTDDDCWLAAPFFPEAATSILASRPEFAILSLWPWPAKILPWRPMDYEVHEDDDVMEHVDVGGVRVCRRGRVKQWPEQTRQGYDREHAEALRAAGWRVGYYKRISMYHLGEGFSETWNR